MTDTITRMIVERYNLIEHAFGIGYYREHQKHDIFVTVNFHDTHVETVRFHLRQLAITTIIEYIDPEIFHKLDEVLKLA